MQTYQLAKRTELRFIIPDELTANTSKKAAKGYNIKLIKGNCEVFGVNLRINEPYQLRSGSYALFTWYGCSVEVNTMTCYHIYKQPDTLQELYVSIHGNLELLRSKETHKDKGGPRVAIVGAEGVGKSTLARTLAAYCARCEENFVRNNVTDTPSDSYGPVYVDLDVTLNSLAIPGTISAESNFKSHNLSVSDGILSKGALTYFVGFEQPSQVPELFSAAVERLAKAVDQKIANGTGNRHSGVIIDTFSLSAGGVNEETEYKLLKHALEALKVDIVLVIGLDRLASDLRTDLDAVTSGSPDPNGLHVLKIPQSGAAIKKSPAQLKLEQSQAFRRYFEGTKEVPLAPFRKTFSLFKANSNPVVENDLTNSSEVEKQMEIKLYRVQDKIFANEALLPIGEQATVKPSNATLIHELSEDLVGKVLGLSYSKIEREILYLEPMRNVAGFAFVEKVNVDKNKITLLLPSPIDLPSINLLFGDLCWTEL